MIKFTAINALVQYVSPEIEIPSKTGGRGFIKRELILDDSRQRDDGTIAPNPILVEFTGDRMAMLDTITPGMRVNVDGMLSGREYNGRVFMSARGFSVTPSQIQPQQQFAASYQQGYAPQQQYAPAPAYQQPSQQFAPQQPAPQQFGNYPSAPTADNLPFS